MTNRAFEMAFLDLTREGTGNGGIMHYDRSIWRGVLMFQNKLRCESAGNNWLYCYVYSFLKQSMDNFGNFQL